MKLVRHLVADEPPSAIVTKASAAFQSGDGDLASVYCAIVEAPESWSPDQSKFKTPLEWFVSAARGLGREGPGTMSLSGPLAQLGQPLWRPGSPAGYDDVAARWAAPDALVRRVEVAQRLACRVGDRVDARALGAILLPKSLGVNSADAIARAEAPATGLSLLLVSPEFQRR